MITVEDNKTLHGFARTAKQCVYTQERKPVKIRSKTQYNIEAAEPLFEPGSKKPWPSQMHKHKTSLYPSKNPSQSPSGIHSPVKKSRDHSPRALVVNDGEKEVERLLKGYNINYKVVVEASPKLKPKKTRAAS